MPNLQQAKRIIIKIGSALLVGSSGNVRNTWLNQLVEDIGRCRARGQQVIIVSSGSVNIGHAWMQLNHHPLRLQEKQAAAAIGQIHLSHAYQSAFATQNITVAQILLTIRDTENRKRYINAKNTLETLLQKNVIPIINENDTVATSEIRYGDNDRLAARVAQMLAVDVLLLLSDIDGLYTQNPRLHAHATFIPQVDNITPDIAAMAGDSTTDYGSGGMKTKLSAAKIATASGCHMIIANGAAPKPLTRIEQGERCTWFIAQTSSRRAHKNWLHHHLKPAGEVIINQGASHAIQQGKSLLPTGITNIKGHFQKGDVLTVLSETNTVIARGLCNYSSSEAKLIMGKHSRDIRDILGYLGDDEFIHRNNMVVM